MTTADILWPTQPQAADGVHRSLHPGLDGGAPILTPDSDLGVEDDDRWMDYRVHRVPSPLWLPPAEASEFFRVSSWRVRAEFAGGDELAGALSGEYEEAVVAGTSRQIYYFDGDTTIDLAGNAPGWTSVRESAYRRRHRKPPPDSAAYADMPFGFASLDLIHLVDLGDLGAAGLRVRVTIVGWRPGWYATRPPDVPGVRPRWFGRSGLTEVWYCDVRTRAEAGPATFGSISPTHETELISVGGQMVGLANTGGSGADAAWEITLDPVGFHAAV